MSTDGADPGQSTGEETEAAGEEAKDSSNFAAAEHISRFEVEILLAQQLGVVPLAFEKLLDFT